MRNSIATAPLLFLALALAVFSPSNAFAADQSDPESLVFVFQKQKNPTEIRDAANKVASFLSDELKMPVKAQVPGDYSASVQALVSKKADIAYTSSLPFLLARRDGGAKMLLAEKRVDVSGVERTDYDSVFVVAKDSPLTSFEELKKNAKDLRIVFTSPTSTSGYIFPYARFVESKLVAEKGGDISKVFKSVNFAGSYTEALQQVADGRADVCAVSYYTVEGSKATSYLPQAEQDKLRILARTPGVPTHIISTRGGLSQELSNKVRDALLKLSAEHGELLSDVYGTASFIEVDEATHVKGAVDAVEATGLPIEGLVKKKG